MPPRPRWSRAAPNRPRSASTAQAEAAAALPPLRQTEAEKAAALHRLVLEREALEAEEARARELAQSLRQRIAQTAQDMERERTLHARRRNRASAAWPPKRTNSKPPRNAPTKTSPKPKARAAELNEALAEAERLLERLTSELAERNARRASLERSRSLAAELGETSGQQLAEAEARLDVAMEGAAEAPDVRAAEDAAEKRAPLALTAAAAAADSARAG